ncbi:MAG: NAD(P) transhydrogenase subunit alpha, partial [Kiritimatiellia bacterium]
MATTIFVPKEIWPGEMRTSMVPDTVRKLTQSGAKVEIESGLGDTIGLSDATYTDAGATITSNRDASLGQADMVIRLRQPGAEDIAKLKKGCIHVSYL